MGKSTPMFFLIYLLLKLIFLPPHVASISHCNGPCQDLNDCNGKLICINRKCTDDPDSDLGTHICACKPSGSLTCRGKAYPTYECSPPITSPTQAILTNNDFSQGGDDGFPSECDGRYHSNASPIVALSTGWYNGGRQCNQMIRINASNGRSVNAKVVDECDSRNGCDAGHAGQGPCSNNIVDGSDAVWDALGLNKEEGEVGITWSMAIEEKKSTVLILSCTF